MQDISKDFVLNFGQGYGPNEDEQELALPSNDHHAI